MALSPIVLPNLHVWSEHKSDGRAGLDFFFSPPSATKAAAGRFLLAGAAAAFTLADCIDEAISLVPWIPKYFASLWEGWPVAWSKSLWPSGGVSLLQGKCIEQPGQYSIVLSVSKEGCVFFTHRFLPLSNESYGPVTSTGLASTDPSIQ